MTVTRGLALFLTVAAAGALVDASGPAAGPARRADAYGSRRSARASTRKGASLVIEASEPVAYVATPARSADRAARLPQRRRRGRRQFGRGRARRARSPASRSKRRSRSARRRRACASRSRSRSRITCAAIATRSSSTSTSRRRRARRPRCRPHRTRRRPTRCWRSSSVSKRRRSDPIGRARASTRRPRRPLPVEPVTPAEPVAPRLAQVAAAAAATPRRRPAAAPGARRRPARRSAADRRNDRKFTGHPISLDFQGADLRAVLRTFAEISGLNIVIDPAVQGTVDVALRDVPWDQALDIILRANKLGYLVDGTIVRIAPLDRARRRGIAAPQARRRAGARRAAERAHQDAQLRQGRGARRRCSRRARSRSAAPSRSTAHQHADHHRPARAAARPQAS